MKMIIKPMFFIFSMMLLLTSCNNEELFVEDTAITEPTTPEDTTSGTDDTSIPSPVTTPCDFTLTSVQPNATVIINCVMDLGGNTITLPSGVTLVYEGGDIVNGTLKFADNTTISGELLNNTLTLTGSKPIMKDPVFDFIPSRWGIVEGNVPMNVAKQNSNIIQSIITKIKSLGVNTLKIDKLDAFFYGTTGYENHNIILPSNFNLVMTDNTHLRAFPSVDSYATFLIIIQNVENVTVTGGHLHGDRDLYDRKDNLPPSHTIRIKTGINILIDNVHMSNATEDGLAIESYRLAYDPLYVPSRDIKITNCIFDSNRRINFTITDGRNIVVENCTFIDGGINTEKSNAAAPSSNIDIEPLKPYQIVNNVVIRNSKQYVRDISKNPNAGGFLISHGDGPIIIENNEMIDCGVSYHTVNGVIIRNNIITNGSIGAGSAETHNRTDIVKNEVYGNTVKTKEIAINVAGNGVNVHDNYFEGSIGISLGAGSVDEAKGLSNSIISNNIIKATSRAVLSMNTMENVTLSDNTINMQQGANFALSLGNIWNKTSDANFIVQNNTVRGFKSSSTTGAPTNSIYGNSIKILNNDFGDVQLEGAKNITLMNNKIDANIGESGVLFYTDAPNSVIKDNIITTYPSKTPLNVQCIKTAANVSLSTSVIIENNNTCNEK
ncbi:hypothetical protein ACFQ1R_00970 [Mariniflexile jejuense]|uniref:Right handed beta helix domain-containing protein n=1 Tax=Mariniflexile jejuense TaxID=1173582 RepID=A0ABW3JGG5_9FLAO